MPVRGDNRGTIAMAHRRNMAFKRAWEQNPDARLEEEIDDYG
jgi:hypothetical protein